jgi:hypothetical protein
MNLPTCNNTGFTLAGNAQDHVMKATRYYTMAEGMLSEARFQHRKLTIKELKRIDDYYMHGDAHQALAEVVDPRAKIYRRKDYPITTGDTIVVALADHNKKGKAP